MAKLASILVAAALAGAVLGGCTAAQPPAVAKRKGSANEAAATEEAPKKDRLPKSMQELELTAQQLREIRALRDDLKRDIDPLFDAGLDFVRAVGVAAKRCKPDTPFMQMEASYMVNVGEQFRPKLLDGVNRFHRILTPKQRHALSDRLLADERKSRDSTADRDQDRARSIGDELDLSFSQIMQMLIRVQALRSKFEDKIDTWREHYRTAVAAFARDDFDAHKQAIAQVPAIELATEVVRDAFRVMLPLLEQKQCEALGGYIEERVGEAEKARARKD